MAFKQKQVAEPNKFLVKIKPLKLEGLDKIIAQNKIAVVAMSVKCKKNKANLVMNTISRSSSMKKMNLTSSKKHVKHGEAIDWTEKEDDEFENFCVDGSLDRWEASFHVLYGETSETTDTKLTVLGKISMSLSELVRKTDGMVEKKIPITLKIDKVAIETVFIVSVTFTEIRSSGDTSKMIIHNSSESNKKEGFRRQMRSMSSKKLDKNKKTKDDNVESSSDMSESVSSPILETQVETVRKLEYWKRRLSFGSSRTQIEPFIAKTTIVDIIDGDRKTDIPASPHSTMSDSKLVIDEAGNRTTTNWVMQEIISRYSKDTAETKLKANVFFASFDQCSQQADGESACTTLSILIAHWLLTNPSSMPTHSEFDTLITQGSSEWRKLLQKNITNSPDNYFDLDTVLNAQLRPLYISPDKSYIGFFSPGKFKALNGVMCFDELWEVVKNTDGPSIYIVSWKDHFFVLTVEADAYYIVDTLGQRLFHGCDKAYILKFDDFATMYVNGEKICEGKECFGDYMKRFLAAISVQELEDEDKKSAVSSIILHQRLQIEFQYMSL